MKSCRLVGLAALGLSAGTLLAEGRVDAVNDVSNTWQPLTWSAARSWKGYRYPQGGGIATFPQNGKISNDRGASQEFFSQNVAGLELKGLDFGNFFSLDFNGQAITFVGCWPWINSTQATVGNEMMLNVGLKGTGHNTLVKKGAGRIVAGGVISDFESLDVCVAVTVADAKVAKVAAYVNGLRLGETAVVGGVCALTLDCTTLTAAPGVRNLLELVARDAAGRTVARNYATLLEDDTPEADSIAEQLKTNFGFKADSEAVQNITTVEEFSKFRRFVTAGGISSANDAQKDCAYQSYRLAPILYAPYLFAERPALDIVDFAADAESGWRLAVELKDGADPVALAVEALRDVVSKSEDLVDWTSVGRDDVQVESDCSNTTRANLVVTPKFSGASGFIRLDVKRD